MFNIGKSLILFFVSICIIVVPAAESFAKDKHSDAQINCDIQQNSCTQPIFGGRITFDIKQKPVKVMTDLTFEVSVSGIDLSGPPVIDLSMPGMKMGRNQIQMKMIQTGVYQGTGVIVRCPSGKTVWQATVDLPGNGNAEFVFDVVY